MVEDVECGAADLARLERCQERVVNDMAAARSTLIELRDKANQCIAQRKARAEASAAPTPDPSTTPAPATPGGTPAPVDPSASPAPSVSAFTPVGTPSPGLTTPVTAPEEC